MIEVPPGPLMMDYDVFSDGYYILTGDGRKWAWTKLGRGQVIAEFQQLGGGGFTGAIRQMLATEGAARSLDSNGWPAKPVVTARLTLKEQPEGW
jgi:hypothetical protein